MALVQYAHVHRCTDRAQAAVKVGVTGDQKRETALVNVLNIH